MTTPTGQQAAARPGPPRNRPPSLNAELRSYTQADSCRLASMLLELDNGTGRAVHRFELIQLWTARFPSHADPERHPNKTVRHRISNAAGRMRGARLLQPVEHGHAFQAVDRYGLAMAARNLRVVQDATGSAVPPRRWTRLPEVPAHLTTLLAAKVQAARQVGPA